MSGAARFDRDRALAVVRAAVEHARRAGAECVAALRGGRSANVRFARNEVTSSGDVTDFTLGVTCALGLRHGSFALNQTDDRSIERAVRMAVDLARLAPEDPEWLPPLGPQKYAGTTARDTATAQAPAARRADAVSAAFAEASRAALDAAGFVEHGDRLHAIATSGGLEAFTEHTEASMSATFRGGDGSGWAASASHRDADVRADAVARTAADKATRSQKPRTLEPGRYTVVLEPEAVANLMGVFVSHLDARRADEGRSMFARPGGGTKVGERLFPTWLTIRSDPANALAPATPFDSEGLPLDAAAWVEGGALRRLARSRFWAKKSGQPAVGAPSSVILEGGKGTVDDLVARVQRGLLVTRFWYIRSVDPQTMLVTGLTRDGLFLIESGRVVGPVRNFRFNESPAAMLANAEAAGTAARVRAGSAGWLVPPVLSHSFHMASLSDAV